MNKNELISRCAKMVLDILVNETKLGNYSVPVIELYNPDIENCKNGLLKIIELAEEK